MRPWVLLVLIGCGSPPADEPDARVDGTVDARSGGWIERTDGLPFGARWGMGATVHDGWLFVAGGANRSSEDRAEVWRSGDGTLWRAIAVQAAFGPRHGASLVSHGGHLWVLGGTVEGGLDPRVWRSIDGGTWMPVGSVAAPVTVALAHDGALWAFTEIASIHRSTDGATWTAIANDVEAIAGREDYAVLAHDGRLWIAGGTRGDQPATDVWSSVDGVDWTRVTDAPAGPALISAGGRMWSVGGAADPSVWSSTDGATWTLEDAAPPWAPRRDHAVVVRSDEIWVIGGRDPDGSPVYEDVWSLDLAP